MNGIFPDHLAADGEPTLSLYPDWLIQSETTQDDFIGGANWGGISKHEKRLQEEDELLMMIAMSFVEVIE